MDRVNLVDFDMVIDDCKDLLKDPREMEVIWDTDTGLKVIFQPLLYPKVIATVVNTDRGVTEVVYLKVIEILDKEVEDAIL